MLAGSIGNQSRLFGEQFAGALRSPGYACSPSEPTGTVAVEQIKSDYRDTWVNQIAFHAAAEISETKSR